MAVEPIPLSTAQRHPLIAVPDSLLLTTAAAEQRLGPMLDRMRAQQQQQRRQPRQPWWVLGKQPLPPPLQQVDPTLLLSLVLATERRKGPASFWWPYIAALGDGIPCGWAMNQEQLSASLAALGSQAAGWEPRVQAAAEAVQQRCKAAVAACGPELGVSAEELRWALGHVMSRCFGSGALGGWVGGDGSGCPGQASAEGG